LSNIAHIDTEKGNAGPSDPLAALEKSTDAQTHLTKVQIPRLESLQGVSEHYNSDPYALSLKARKRFRTEKKADKEKQAVDNQLKNRYGLPETLHLVQDDDGAKSEAKLEWEKGRRELERRDNAKRRRLSLDASVLSMSSSSIISRSQPGSSSSSQSRRRPSNTVTTSLRARILENTARQSNPFGRKVCEKN
jgi:coiled-coil domain-containing protein 130